MNMQSRRDQVKHVLKKDSINENALLLFAKLSSCVLERKQSYKGKLPIGLPREISSLILDTILELGNPLEKPLDVTAAIVHTWFLYTLPIQTQLIASNDVLVRFGFLFGGRYFTVDIMLSPHPAYPGEIRLTDCATNATGRINFENINLVDNPNGNGERIFDQEGERLTRLTANLAENFFKPMLEPLDVPLVQTVEQ
ncbi:uncharacterized protein LOC135835056 [Planococcus citri]|uniref:uncharacterized protein LOC135835056 n=1 Tax=Planococcus citri TaxID=170843 RepID=UPI0031FA3A3D